MLRDRIVRLLVAPMAVLLGHATTATASFIPWDALVSDAWIYIGPPQQRLVIHTVNGPDYEIGFDQARGDNSARGMKALKFSFEGANTGHLVSNALTGSFAIENTGASRTFSDLVILVAIDAGGLPPGFAMSLAAWGQPPYSFDPSIDFGYYDHPEYDTGRPSGYYSITSPTGEGISYAFDQAMVTAFAVQGALLGPGGSLSVDYTFEKLPGTAVFSVYGLDSSVGWIYHTNRAVIDENRPSEPVSTFEVVPPCSLLGDVNDDGVLDAEDIAAYTRVKLGWPDPGDNAACADYGTGTLDGDTALFVADLLGVS